MAANLIYITTRDKEEAYRIAQEMVKSRLAACANILDGMESIYWWEGKLESNRETVLWLKTREDLVEAVISKVKELHSYSCPCVVAIPILQGNPDYLGWIERETLSNDDNASGR